MIPLTALIDFAIHFDKYLSLVIQDYNTWVYLFLFLIVFIETGFVFVPFLPGDSLIFIAGTFAGVGLLDPYWLFAVFVIGAILGDTVNYWIGYHAGPKIFRKKNARFMNIEYLKRTHEFYHRYGGKVIVIARFLPIIRTFAPFVAGIGRMKYRDFIGYNILGGMLWVTSFLLAGFYIGNIPVVKENLSLVLAAIIIVSVVIGVWEFIRNRPKK